MDLPDAPPIAVNSCVSCKQGKRKCDRARPICSTCTRVNRPCHYEEDTYLPHSTSSYHSHSHHSHSDDGISSHSQTLSSRQLPSNVLFTAPNMHVDPFRHASLRQPTVNVAVSTEATKILGSIEDIRRMATKYFDTIWLRLPIISQVRFLSRLATVFADPQADYIVLCLAIHLLLQQPAEGEKSMVSESYVMIKSYISMLESTGFWSLEVVQARLLVVFYELGHGIQDGASISIATCARSARLLGLNKKVWQERGDRYEEKVKAEEEKRVWWAVVNLDRFICLCNGDSLFTTEDPSSSDTLPIEDTLWAQNIIPSTAPHTLSTPSDITVGHYARECQISHLVGRALRHVYEPSSDAEFHAQEAMQLERTLMAFMPLLIEEHTKFGLYCAALGMCTNALFLLHDSALFSASTSPSYKTSLLSSLHASSTQITEFSRHLFGDINAVDLETVSPLIPHSLYQAAVVQYRLEKQSGEIRYRNGLESLKEILGYFGRRWCVGGRYLEALRGLTEEYPTTTLPLSGVYNPKICRAIASSISPLDKAEAADKGVLNELLQCFETGTIDCVILVKGSAEGL